MTLSLIVGLGSIGARHRDVLENFGQVETVSRRGNGTYDTLEGALATRSFDYVVVANETSAHFETMKLLSSLAFDGYVMVEKPLFDRVQMLDTSRFKCVGVGYNLRFHPVIGRIKKAIKNRKVLAIQSHVGQHLSTWRTNRPYQESYSANADMGGGVLRDLSHEIDYIDWLFGPFGYLSAQINVSKSLGIDSDDIVQLSLGGTNLPMAQIMLDYHAQPPRRNVTVILADGTIHADLVGNRIVIDGRLEEIGSVERNESFIAMHSDFLAEAGNTCSYEQGLRVNQIISAAERASTQHIWTNIS